MMVLVGLTFTKVLLGILTVSLALLLLYIGYKKLLAFLGKGLPVAEDYCVLYTLEKDPAMGELEFYFTNECAKTVALELLNADMSLNQLIIEQEYPEGGHIVRFDSTRIANGNYFYALRTDNQKTMKKMTVQNA